MSVDVPQVSLRTPAVINDETTTNSITYILGQGHYSTRALGRKGLVDFYTKKISGDMKKALIGVSD